MSVSVIICVYKDYASLNSVLHSLCKQSYKDFEVCIAQDADDQNILPTLNNFTGKLELQLLQQEDLGFRKNLILNKAILKSKYDKIIFIDGDCVMHRHFIKNYNKHIKKGRFCAGRRLDLDSITSRKLIENPNTNPSLIDLFKNKTKRIEERLYAPCLSNKFLSEPKLIGCNMGWYKDDLIQLNGFDTEYSLPGYGEDSDIEWRAKALGMVAFTMRFKAIQFHLFHERPDRESEVSQSKELMHSKKQLGHWKCLSGMYVNQDN
jgi:glycosyltransferase involved in cell wall biosynthesis